MTETVSQSADLSDESVEDIVSEHSQELAPSALQRVVDWSSDLVGRPIFVFCLIVIVAGWLTFNFFAQRISLSAFDKPPFVGLELTVTIAALLLAAIIIATQRREDRLANRRAQLTLHLAVLADRKNAKIIALLEEMRRDSPALTDRVDRESDAMSSPADTEALLKNMGQS